MFLVYVGIQIFFENIYIHFVLGAIYRFQFYFCELKILGFCRGTNILKLKILAFFSKLRTT